MSMVEVSKETPPSGWRKIFSSVSVRLKTIAVITTCFFVLLTYEGIKGMQMAADSIEDLYSEGMQHTIRAGKVLDELGSARSQLLLAFQHEPGSQFVDMHDHVIDQHIESIQRSVQALHHIIDNEILSSPLSDMEKAQVNRLADKLDDITQNGFNTALQYLKENRYTEANLTLLKKINPLFKQVTQEAEGFLSIQIEEGASNFQQANHNIKQYMWMATILVSIAVLTIIGLSVLIVRRISLASQQLGKSSDLISKGDLTQRIQLTGQDEFAHIAQYVNRIVASFQHVVQTNKDSTTQLALAAEESSAVAVQTKQNVIDQQTQTQLVATAIHEFTATVNEVAQSASNAASASEQADRAAEQGQSIVQETITMISNLSQEMQESVVGMQRLARETEEIGSVVDVIQGISEQTNLLALNAAIEAARAGEQGRGFAVVADEVRTLASRTQKSTEEIQQTIQRLQQGSRESTTRLESGADNARLAVDKAQLAGESLTQITAAVDQINAMNAQIATAAEQQSLVTEDINQNITIISDIANQTASGAEQSSQATLELARLAETLKAETETYRV
ncbi:methyl-accepting chemotaxis protein [Vibrio aestuarianus]|uniref:methyl-accepting chemotaxis protein n=1 Tax=Vibrio aestuarianus TaxID=28171 RepID=UPI0030B8C9C8